MLAVLFPSPGFGTVAHEVGGGYPRPGTRVQVGRGASEAGSLCSVAGIDRQDVAGDKGGGVGDATGKTLQMMVAAVSK